MTRSIQVSTRLSVQEAANLQQWATRNGWTLSQALKRSVRVAVLPEHQKTEANA